MRSRFVSRCAMAQAAIVVFLAFVGSTLAADLPSRKEPPRQILPPPPPMWSGFYGGVNVGGGWISGYGSAGVLGGGQIGYNYQVSPMFVLGLETDIQGSSAGNGGQNAWSPASRGIDWFGTVRGRVGVSALTPQLLIYGTGGFAYGDLRLFEGPIGVFSQVGTGWAAGGGVEYMFTPNLSGKIEYLRVDIGANYPIMPLAPTQQRANFNVVRAGLNYHFNWTAGAPVLARF